MKALSFTELALLYNPHVSEKTARRILREWLRINISLQSELAATGFTSQQRILTPLQVSYFYQFLGEP